MPSPEAKKNTRRIIGAHNIHKPEDPLNVEETIKIQSKLHGEKWGYRIIGLITLLSFLYIPYWLGINYIDKVVEKLGGKFSYF